MNLKFYKIIASLLILMVLSACGDDACVRECDDQGKNCLRECGSGHCVEADDWGYPKIYVSAESKDLSIRSGDPVLSQYAEGIDSGQVLIDADYKNLVIQIGKKDQWTSWFGGDINPRNSDGVPDEHGFDGGRTVPDIECLYYLPSGKPSPGTFADDLSPTTLKLTKDFSGSVSNNGKTLSPTQLGITPDIYADSRTPCYFRYGMGLYIGLAPNRGPNTSSDDVVLTYHIPDAKKPDYGYNNTKTDADNLSIQARDGYLVRGFPATELPGSQTGDRLYFKIVDNTYIDNTGGYNVKIKEGTRSISPGPLEKISAIIIVPMKLVVSRIYNGIVKNNYYIDAVRAALILYIVFYGFVFLMGGYSLGHAKGDVLFRIGKIALVLILISDSSWSFFYKYFFSVFLGGAQEFAGLLLNPFGDYDPGNPWYSMDQLLAKFWSAETWSKIASTLLSNNTGILFILAILFALRLFIGALVQGLAVYFISFASLCILILLAPLVLVLMLFNQTKKQTEEWINQMVVFVIQQIILFAALGMFAAVILMFLERTIGYHVCWNIWNSFGMGDIHIFDFKFWMPDISKEQSAIWIDSDGDGIKEFVTRYTDLPYFDPLFDRDKIASYQSESNFISLSDIIIFLCSIFLMHRFMECIEPITSALKSTASFDSTNIFAAGGSFANSVNAGRKQIFNPTSGIGSKTPNRGLLLNSARDMYGAAQNFRKSDGGKYLLGKASEALSSGKTAAGNTTAGKSISKAVENMRIAGSGHLDSLNPSLVKNRMEAMGVPHDVQVHENIMSHQDGIQTHTALISGANLADKNIMEKSDAAKRGELLRAQFEKDISSVNKLENSISNFASKVGSPADKAKFAKPIFDSLKDSELSGSALARIAKVSSMEIDNIHANLTEQLQNPQKHGLTKGDVMMIQENLDKIKKAANIGRVAREALRVPTIINDLKNDFKAAITPYSDYKVRKVDEPGTNDASTKAKDETSTTERTGVREITKGNNYNAADAAAKENMMLSQAGRSAAQIAPKNNAQQTDIDHALENEAETAADHAKKEADKARRKAEEEEEARKRAEAEALRKAAEEANKNKPTS